MSNEIPVIDAVFGHYFDSCQISSSELDHAYKEVCNSVADEDVVALIDTLCLADYPYDRKFLPETFRR